MSELKQILEELVSYASITPNDNGCQDYLIEYLTALGFECTILNDAPVSNFFARFGTNRPLIVFAGHTDVVPVGSLEKWDSDPFVLTQVEDKLYGRGTADMKGSIASMMTAVKRFIEKHTPFNGSIGFLITSGEEGDHYNQGTPYVMNALAARDIIIDYCIVGEPTSTTTLADTIKIGRRGSLTGNLVLKGKQGHVAYPHLAANPIHLISPVLNQLCEWQWDKGDEFFPPSSFQITSIQSGGIAGNVIPGELLLQFNFRYSPLQTEDSIKRIVAQCFEQHHLQPEIEWRLSGRPFLTSTGKLLNSVVTAIQENTAITPELSTSGGTSDGRFIAPYGVEVIELGPINATIHQVNECVSMTDLLQLESIYLRILEKIFEY